MPLFHGNLQMPAFFSVLSDESLHALASSLLFMLIGAACVTGARCFEAVCSGAALSYCRQAWKRYNWSFPQISRRKTSVTKHLRIPQRIGAPSLCSRSLPKESQTWQEHFVLEVADLLAEGKLRSAIDLVRDVRLARGALQLELSSLRLISQRLARSPCNTDIFRRFTEELAHASDAPGDRLVEGCYVRYLCRSPHADIDQAYEAYSAMLGRGITPDLRTVECLAEACLQRDRHAWVKPLVFGLSDYGMEPSAVLYSSLITSCGISGAVACGMAAFEQMRPHMAVDPEAFRLGYSSVINMCAQNHQVTRALKLWAESNRSTFGRGTEAVSLDARLLPPLLVAAVQTGQEELALDLASQARDTTSAAPPFPESIALAAKLSTLSELLSKRNASRALMAKVSAILSGEIPMHADGHSPVGSTPSSSEDISLRQPCAQAKAILKHKARQSLAWLQILQIPG